MNYVYASGDKRVTFRKIFLYLLCTHTPVAGIKEPEGDKSLRRSCVAFIFAALLCAPGARAQAGPVEGGHELQVWTGGGHGINGSQSGDAIWNAGFRYGLILTAPHGPGFLRGRLEYAVDAVPVFLIVQKTNTAYGVGVDPFAFKWALDTHGSVVPYLELGGGVLFTNTKVPENTSRTNFTTSGALGLHFLRSRHNISAEVRYMHISNAGLATPNPGINTIQLRIGFGLFSQKE
jgi:lipid A 3-O-deacylase